MNSDWDDDFEREADWDEDFEGEEPDENFSEDDSVEMVPCPECGELVYEEAQQCPSCGWYVTPERSKLPPWIVVTAVVCLLAIILTLIGPCI